MWVVTLIELYFNNKPIRKLFIPPRNKRINVWGNQRRRKLAMAFLQKPDKWCVHTPCPGSVSGCGRSDVKPSLTSVMLFSVIYRKVFWTHPLCSNLHCQTFKYVMKTEGQTHSFFFCQHVTGTVSKNHWIL